jgi:hypothetical protein
MKTGSKVNTAADVQWRGFRAAAWRERLPDISGERRCQSQYRGLRPSETGLRVIPERFTKRRGGSCLLVALKRLTYRRRR